jgi:hypothetical protein
MVGMVQFWIFAHASKDPASRHINVGVHFTPQHAAVHPTAWFNSTSWPLWRRIFSTGLPQPSQTNAR